MAELIPQLISLAIGDILSPLTLAALITLLLTPRAKVNGLIFTGASVVGVFVVTAFAALATNGVQSVSTTASKTLVVVLGFIFSAGFLALAILSWRSRPAPGQQAKEPRWLAAADTMTPLQVAGVGLSLAMLNAKGLPLALKAGAHIGKTGWGPVAAIGLSVAFALAASLLLIALTGIAAIGSPTITKALNRTKLELIDKNAVIMATVFAMLAAIQLGEALRPLLH